MEKIIGIQMRCMSFWYRHTGKWKSEVPFRSILHYFTIHFHVESYNAFV